MGTLCHLARPERFELPTAWFVARYSIQLSYGRIVQLRGVSPRRGVHNTDPGSRGKAGFDGDWTGSSNAAERARIIDDCCPNTAEYGHFTTHLE